MTSVFSFSKQHLFPPLIRSRQQEKMLLERQTGRL